MSLKNPMFALLAIFASMTAMSFGPSPYEEAAAADQQSKTDQRVTDQPMVTKIQPTPNGEKKAAETGNNEPSKSDSDWKVGREINPITGTIKQKTIIRPEVFSEAITPNSAKRIYFFGRVVYEDVFGSEHQTTFCSFINPFSIQRNADGSLREWQWAPAAGYNDIT